MGQGLGCCLSVPRGRSTRGQGVDEINFTRSQAGASVKLLSLNLALAERKAANMNVADWLRTLGLEQYEALFHQNDIDAEVLPTLDADDLRELGVSSLGHRKKLLVSFQWTRRVSSFELLEDKNPIAAWRSRMLDLFGGLARAALAGAIAFG
jgi:hypothetical protein